MESTEPRSALRTRPRPRSSPRSARATMRLTSLLTGPVGRFLSIEPTLAGRMPETLKRLLVRSSPVARSPRARARSTVAFLMSAASSPTLAPEPLSVAQARPAMTRTSARARCSALGLEPSLRPLLLLLGSSPGRSAIGLQTRPSTLPPAPPGSTQSRLMPSIQQSLRRVRRRRKRSRPLGLWDQARHWPIAAWEHSR
jgi:hypothetical protein